MTEKELRSKAKDIVSFKRHLLTYLLVMTGLFAMDYYDNGHIEWAYYAAMGWGVGILSHYASIKSGGVFSVEKEMEQLRKKGN
ncbi:MAG: 2TM domain-containing protein [Flavobacteriaceae bacterium]|nr:2TM domain-containing protein [Flavobacteriaceae bacterium]